MCCAIVKYPRPATTNSEPPIGTEKNKKMGTQRGKKAGRKQPLSKSDIGAPTNFQFVLSSLFHIVRLFT